MKCQSTNPPANSHAFIAIDCALTNCTPIPQSPIPINSSYLFQPAAKPDLVDTLELAAAGAHKTPDIDTIFEMQHALTSGITPRQGPDPTDTYRDLLRLFGLDPDEVYERSSVENLIFAFQKNAMRNFMAKQGLGAYSPHFVELKDTSTSEEKQQLQEFFNNCIASKTTGIVIKGVHGTRGEDNFFYQFNYKDKGGFEDFYNRLTTLINQITQKERSHSTGFCFSNYWLKREELLIEQCRNHSLDLASDQIASTFRLVLAIKLNAEGEITCPETDVKCLVTNMKFHHQWNSHGLNRTEICFFDDRMWTVENGQYAAVTPSLTLEMRALRQRINESPALRKTMVRLAQAIALQRKIEGVKPSSRSTGIVNLFDDVDPFDYLRKPPCDNMFLALPPLALMYGTEALVRWDPDPDQKGKKLRATIMQLKDEGGKIDLDQTKNPSYIQKCINFIQHRYVCFVSDFLAIESFNNPDRLNGSCDLVKKALLFLLLGPEKAEQIKDRLVLCNPFTADDLTRLKSLSKTMILPQRQKPAEDPAKLECSRTACRM